MQQFKILKLNNIITFLYYYCSKFVELYYFL